MDKADQEFIETMIAELDGDIRKLVREEQEMAKKLGIDRVKELAELWGQELDEEEELELKTALDYQDKKMLFIWSRLKRLHRYRAQAGQAYMRRKQINNR